jgi:hypothetical protein
VRQFMWDSRNLRALRTESGPTSGCTAHGARLSGGAAAPSSLRHRVRHRTPSAPLEQAVVVRRRQKFLISRLASSELLDAVLT